VNDSVVPLARMSVGVMPESCVADAAALPATGEALGAWLGFARSAVRSLAGGPLLVEVWDGEDAVRRDPVLYAFLLKQTALALRAEADAAQARIVVAQAVVPAHGREWQDGLWAAGAAPYVDALPFSLDAGLAPEAQAARLREMTAALWTRPWRTGWSPTSRERARRVVRARFTAC